MPYIDRGKAFDVLTEYYHHKTLIQKESLKEALSRVPTADVVEVVRCKDCKYHDGSCCDYSAVYINPNGYCQWGERKDGEHEYND